MTLRKNSERPVTIAEGTNCLVEMTAQGIVKAYRRIRQASEKGKVGPKSPKLWDGKAAQRIVRIIAEA
jgi:UDP-N-acetylglucosamine 2-epimerase (non-hydrolysing)